MKYFNNGYYNFPSKRLNKNLNVNEATLIVTKTLNDCYNKIEFTPINLQVSKSFNSVKRTSSIAQMAVCMVLSSRRLERSFFLIFG